MRRDRIFLVMLVVVFLVSGCASIGRVAKNTFWPDIMEIPAPQPGLVLLINRSPAVWADCFLFPGHFREEELILPHPAESGKLMFALPLLKQFVIAPPVNQARRSIFASATTVPLLMSFPADYTLLVFHRNFRGEVVEVGTERFSTTGFYRNEYVKIGGKKIYADQIIRLARVRPYENRQFRFHRTYYPGHALLSALGF
ncbi:MAG: hypothetical protein ABIF84_02335 [Patescibacteria group bacterium]